MSVVLRGSIAAGSELAGYRDRAFDTLVIRHGCRRRPQQEIDPLANHRRHRHLPFGGDPLDAPRLFIGQPNLCTNYSDISMFLIFLDGFMSSL